MERWIVGLATPKRPMRGISKDRKASPLQLSSSEQGMEPKLAFSGMEASQRYESAKANVLHLRASPFLGSPERLLLGQLKYMEGTRCKYIVGLFDEQEGERNVFMESLLARGSNAYRFPGSALAMVSNLIRIMRIVRREGITLICCHDYKSNLLGLLTSLLLRIPLVSVFHGRTSHNLRVRLYEKLDDRLLRHFDKVIAVCEAAKATIEKRGVHPEKIVIINNGIALTGASRSDSRVDIRKTLGISESDRVVVYAGRLSKEKGLFVLLDAAALALQCMKNIKFVILGTGPLAARLQARIHQLGLEQHVMMAGFRQDIEAFLWQMDLCVLPSFSECMPLVILEAFACSKPVVATRVGGLTELVENGVHGILVEPGDCQELAAGMVSILADPGRAKAMGIAGHERVRREFTLEQQADAYLRVFCAVLHEETCGKART